MYWKNNDDFGVEIKVGNGMVDMFVLFDVRYFVLFQEDFVYLGFECWVENEDQIQELYSCYGLEGFGN